MTQSAIYSTSASSHLRAERRDLREVAHFGGIMWDKN